MAEHKKLEKSISDLEKLAESTPLSVEEAKQLKQVTEVHPMRVNPYYLSLIDWDDPNDPIRKMAVPSVEELNLEGVYDTSGEAENTKMPGLQHKYAETALVIATNRCAMYCRYCFRKRLVGLPSEEIMKRFDDAVNYIAEHKEINNVLISGGDPLVLKNGIIEHFLEKLSNIDHLSFVRIGSRIPVTFPERLSDPEILAVFKKYTKLNRRLYIVTHFNHPKEITPQSIQAVNNLLQSGVLISNQTVLLKGVNDNPETLSTLMNQLISIGVMPYYVFQCRPVKRTKHHFQMPLSRGIEIVEQAKVTCNGHSKRFKYIMSHITGKIEILGTLNNEIYFKYHQAKDRQKLGKIFKRPIHKTAGWLDNTDKDGFPTY